MSTLLEPDLLSYAQSISTDSTQSKSTNLRAPCWEYCRPATQDDPQQDALYCIKCTTKPYGTRISKNMTNHLRVHHQIIVKKALRKGQVVVNEQLKQLWYQAQVEGFDEVQEFDTEVLGAYLNIAVIIEALISLIVIRNLSFALVEWPEFHTFCQALNRACEGKITTSHSGVYNKVKEAWERHKDVVRRTLQSAVSLIHISLDIWTSPNRWLLLAVCAHFTTYDYKRQKALLAL